MFALRSVNTINDPARQLIGALCLFVVFAGPAPASEAEPIYGRWGNESQCAETLILPTGTKHFAPFDIRPDWLRHGDTWCRLRWRSAGGTPESFRAVASALCGEDSERDYLIRFELKDSELTLTWNPEIQNGPLRRCTR